MLKEFREHFVGVLTLIIFSLAVYGLVKLSGNAKASVNSPVPEQNCCLDDHEKPHLLSAAYYRVTSKLKAKLLLNNKGPYPLEAQPTLFSKDGQRYDVGPVIVDAESFRMIDLAEWVRLAGPEFEEGSIQVFHLGRDLVLGAQVYLVDEDHSLSFDEKLVEMKTFKSSRLEGLWWMPSQRGEVRLALSNTSDAPVTVTASVEGHTPERAGDATVELAPHQTRLLNVLDDLMHHEHGAMSRFGSISLQHSGAPGALLARAMAQDASTGYSLSVQFSDPKAAKLSKLQGVGLRLGSIGSQSLTPVIVARNVGSTTTRITGRVPYTASDGVNAVLPLPDLQLASGEMAIIDVEQALRRHAHQGIDALGGLEFEYSTEPGSVSITALSVSDDGNQVFRVPMWDIYGLRSSTGGYPWYIDGNSSTMVFIKNGEDHEQRYFLHIRYLGGVYTIGSKTIAAGQTVTYDLRKMRDEQVPDNDGHVIPPYVTSGQLHWSKVGGERGVLIGRSEQTDTQLGISSNYACMNCCNDNADPTTFQVSPSSASVLVGESRTFTATVEMRNCYTGGNDAPIVVEDVIWSSSNPDVAVVGAGVALAQTPGSTNIGAVWHTNRYLPAGGGFPGEFQPIGGTGECTEDPITYNTTPATFAVFAVSVESNVDTVRPSGTGGTSTATIKVATNPPWPNQNVQLSLSAGSSAGGHVSHSGTRPLGTLDATQGQTNSQGIFETTYHAPIFGGSVIISGTLNGFPASNTLEYLVVVPGLSALGVSADYSLVGQLPTHPSNHWGNATAITNLPLIAGDYLNQFPGADKLQYNDMSLEWGGKFDLTNNWSGSSDHQEHLIGINCDVYSGNVPTSRWPALTLIFQLRGSPSYGDETSSANHWHLRFSQ